MMIICAYRPSITLAEWAMRSLCGAVQALASGWRFFVFVQPEFGQLIKLKEMQA